MRRWAKVRCVVLAAALLVFFGFLGGTAAAAEDSHESTNESSQESYMDGFGPPDNSSALTSDDIECGSCHNYMPTNTEERTIEYDDPPHPSEIDHGDGRFWCLQCHSKEDRDKLKLTNGTLVAYGPENSTQMCAGCHGPTYEEWQDQIHGAWSGSWEDPETNRYCVDCHNPHDPSFGKLTPVKAPTGPPPTSKAGLILPNNYALIAIGVIALMIGLVAYAAWPPRNW